MFGIFKRLPPSVLPSEENPGDPLRLVIVPALVAILQNAEKQKGGPLTEAEVIRIRDDAQCIAMPTSAAAAVEAERGYSDIDLEAAWTEWQRVRIDLDQSLSP